MIQRQRILKTRCFIICFFILSIAVPHSIYAESLYSLSKKGQEAYDAGDYQKALDYFIKAQLEAPDNPLVYYNLGNTQYKNGDYDSALNHYKQALKSDDKALKQKSHFNMGNTYFKKQDFEKSISEYKDALKLDPNDEDAKKNIAFVKKVKEQIQKQKNQNKDDQKIDQDNKDKDQDKSGQDQKNQDQKDQKKDQQNQDQKNKGQDKKDGSKPKEDQDKDKEPQPSGGEDEKDKKPESANARKANDEKPGDEEKKQAEKMLNRLKDEPGRALIPAYQQRDVDKDW